MKLRALLTLTCVSLIVCASTRPISLSGQIEQQQPKTFMVYDFGRSSCGLWLEVRTARNAASDIRFVQAHEWIAGFLSAYNWYVDPRGNVAKGTDREGMSRVDR
jgi:hypothetical protein